MHQTLPPDHLYHELMQRLVSRLEYIRIQPQYILQYGRHTQVISAWLKNHYPDAVNYNTHDLQSLSVPETFDLIIAHYPFLIARDPLPKLFQLLREGGLLLLTSLGPDTFCELQNSAASVNGHLPTQTFWDMHVLGDALRSAQFSDPVMDREMLTIAYTDLFVFFQDLKTVGAAHVFKEHSRGLLSPRRWRQIVTHYAQYKTDHYFPVTVEMIYGSAWKIKTVSADDSEAQETVMTFVRGS